MAECAVCSSSPATPCTGCHTVAYCGKECQKKDWRQHKAGCKAYKIVHCEEEHGRSLAAARDLKPGERVMQVPPLAVGPRLHGPPPCCLGCYQTRGQLLKCTQCGLPVCSEKCANSKIHMVECGQISESRSRGHTASLSLPVTTPLRILGLRSSRPSAFTTVLSLESNLEVLRSRPVWSYLEKWVIDPILGLELEGVDRQMVESIAGIILTNNFEVDARGTLLIGLFFEPAMMNHHCVGNTRLTMDDKHLLTVLTSLPIKKNGQVKFNYVRALDTTAIRQAMLLENKYFSCLCERCLDPTELGSYSSALRCPTAKCDGPVVPKNPVTGDGIPVAESLWLCLKCEAQVVQARELLADIVRDMETLNKDNIKEVKELLTKYSTLLYKNNGVMVELKQMMISGMGRLPGYQMHEMKEAQHKEKIVLCHDVLSVLNKIEPGMTLGRGLMLFELHSSLVMVANLEYERNQTSGQLLSRLLEASQLLGDAWVILRLEAPNSPYGHLANTVKQNMAELEQYIDSVKNM